MTGWDSPLCERPCVETFQHSRDGVSQRNLATSLTVSSRFPNPRCGPRCFKRALKPKITKVSQRVICCICITLKSIIEIKCFQITALRFHLHFAFFFLHCT